MCHVPYVRVCHGTFVRVPCCDQICTMTHSGTLLDNAAFVDTHTPGRALSLSTEISKCHVQACSLPVSVTYGKTDTKVKEA